jgi:cyanamide hydratase
MGFHGEVIHPETIGEVVAKYPRDGWSGCFANVIREEIGLKPYCHSTVIEGFADLVENNELMKPYDK